MKAAIYARVSTTEQETQNQLTALIGWARSRGFGIHEIYKETQSAWKDGHQAEFKRLLDDADRRRFDVVLVWALDRVSREGALAVLRIIDRLTRCDVRLYSYQEPWTEAPGELADILYSIAAWVAKMESQRRSERTKAGLERARLEGRLPGRPKGSKDKKRRKKRTHV